MLEPFGAKRLFVLLRFARWDDVLKLPAPDTSAAILTTVHHFGRGVAHAALGRAAEAERDRDAYRAAQRAVPADAAWGYNTAHDVHGRRRRGARCPDRRREGRRGRLDRELGRRPWRPRTP